MYIYFFYNLYSRFSAIEKGHLAHSREADLCCHAALPLLKSVWHTPGPKCPDEIMNWVPRIVRNRKSTFAIALATQGGKQKRSIAPDQTEWLEISPSCLEEQESRRGEHKKCWKGISCSKGLHRKMDCNPLLTFNFHPPVLLRYPVCPKELHWEKPRGNAIFSHNTDTKLRNTISSNANSTLLLHWCIGPWQANADSTSMSIAINLNITQGTIYFKFQLQQVKHFAASIGPPPSIAWPTSRAQNSVRLCASQGPNPPELASPTPNAKANRGSKMNTSGQDCVGDKWWYSGNFLVIPPIIGSTCCP